MLSNHEKFIVSFFPYAVSYDGQIALYDRALSTAEIEDLYQRGI